MPIDPRPAKPDVDSEVEVVKGRGPSKSARSTSTRAIRGKTVKKPSVAASKKSAAGQGRVTKELSEQKKRRSRAVDTYVRFRVRVEDGNLRVVDSHVVEGTLEPTTSFAGQYAYEVSLDGQRLHTGSLPDLGVQRSFPPPGPAGAQAGHNVKELPSYGFDVRVPAKDLSTRALGSLQIRLLRVKDSHDRDLDSHTALDRHIETNMREIAQVTGIPASLRPTLTRAK